MKNTTISIENENGKYEISAPIGPTIDDVLDLTVVAFILTGYHQESIDKAIVELAEQIKEKR